MALRTKIMGNGNVMIWNDGHLPEDGGCIQIYTPEEWDAFLKGVKNDEFDLDVIHADRECA